MTAPQTSNYGTANDWSQIISGAGQGASNAMQGNSAYINSRAEAKEAKRRTLANLMNQALKRGQGMHRIGQEYSDDMTDFKSQAMQQVARGFVEALHGSTGY